MSSSSYSQPMDSRLWMHSHEFKFLFPANGSQTAILSSYSPANELNLRMHSHEFLFPCQWTQDSDCNLEFLFPANESQTAFP